MTQDCARRKSLLNWRPGKLAKNGGTLLGWMLLRAVAQAATVLVLARQLGAHDYGQVVAVIAVASFLVPITGLGLSHIVLRNAARDPTNEPVYFARAFHWWWRTLLPSVAIGIAVATILLPSAVPLVAMCAAITSEIAATSMTELRARHCQAQHQIHAFGAINAGLPLCRLLTIGLLLLLNPTPAAPTVLWAYAVSGLLYLMFLWRSVPSNMGLAHTSAPETMTVSSGLPFSLAVLAARLQAEFNKPILAQVSFGLAGSYNVAQRVVDMASLPLLAMQEALWPRLYAQPDPMHQLRRTGLILLGLALILGVIMWLAAPLLPAVLGESFANTVNILRMLAWLPLLQVFRALLNFHAIHYGQMHRIGWASTLGAIVSVVGVAVFVPTYGMAGAVATGYLAEVAMTAFLLIVASVQRKTH